VHFGIVVWGGEGGRGGSVATSHDGEFLLKKTPTNTLKTLKI